MKKFIVTGQKIQKTEAGKVIYTESLPGWLNWLTQLMGYGVSHQVIETSLAQSDLESILTGHQVNPLESCYVDVYKRWTLNDRKKSDNGVGGAIRRAGENIFIGDWSWSYDPTNTHFNSANITVFIQVSGRLVDGSQWNVDLGRGNPYMNQAGTRMVWPDGYPGLICEVVEQTGCGYRLRVNSAKTSSFDAMTGVNNA